MRCAHLGFGWFGGFGAYSAQPRWLASMSTGQSSAFSSYGPGWLTPSAVDLFFASFFAVFALLMLAAAAMDCYTAWQNGQLKIGEAGKIVLKLTCFISFLLFIIR